MSTALFTVVKFEICKADGKCKISGYPRDFRSTSRETHPTYRNETNDLILNLDLNQSNETETVFNAIIKLLLKHSYPLFPLALITTENISTEFMSGFLMMLKLHTLSARMLLTAGSKINLLTIVLYMITISQNANIIAWLCINFLICLKLTE